MRLGFHSRLIIFITIVALVVMGGLVAVQSAPECLANAACVRRSAWVAAGCIVVAAALTAWLTTRRALGSVRQLARVMRRIAAGEWDLHVLPQQGDEIGELVRAFIEMRERLEQDLGTLSQRERQLSTVLDQMGDGVLIVGESGDVWLINPAAARMLRTTKEATLGRTFAEVARHHELIEVWQHSLEDEQEQIAAVEIGDSQFWQIAVTPFWEKESRGYLVMLHDLTDVRRLETVRRDFISNLSHELRTPLASLRAVVETLQDGALSDPPSAERFLAHAAGEVDLLTQMTEELLELSRIESGRVPLQIAPTAVIDLLHPAVERLRRQAKRNKLKLHLDLPPDLPMVLADTGRITQVVTNLLHNAIKFTPPKGEIRIAAYLDTSPENGEGSAAGGHPVVTIKLSDTGVGIAAEDLPRIFERFYKSDPARTHGHDEGGIGLGLSIARNIVEAHDGRIWAKSRPGKGSTFFFTLPVSE